jgi:hypothetical protein
MKALRWILSALFSLMALYCLSTAYESASLSVPAEGPLIEIYQTRAMLYMLVSILQLAVGAA